MLVLKRREGSTIYIGDEITITIVQSSAPVKVGIDAPPRIRIIRDDAVNGAPPDDAPTPPDDTHDANGPLAIPLAEMLANLRAIERAYGSSFRPIFDLVRSRAMALARQNGRSDDSP